MSLGIKTLVAIGGLGGGVLVPWSLSKLRSNGSDLTSPQLSVDVSVPIERTEESHPSHAQLPKETLPSTSQHSEEESSTKTLEAPSQAPSSSPEVSTKKEETETGDCTALVTVPEDINSLFWTTGEDSKTYVTISCENVDKNPLITANNWGGLFPEKLFATLRSSLTGKKFDIKMEVTPTESGLNNYTVIFDGGNKFNSPVTGTWAGETQNTNEKTLKVIEITAPPASSTEKIYIWSN